MDHLVIIREIGNPENKKNKNLGRENKHDYIRKNERIHYIDDD
jgi:hypothetical protein